MFLSPIVSDVCLLPPPPPYCLLNTPLFSHKTRSQWQESQLRYLLLNLPCFPLHKSLLQHMRLFSSAILRCILLVLMYVLPLPPTLTKCSFALYCLWHCFIIASYMHIVGACSMQAAWFQWNVCIIYHLQSAFATLTKFSQQSHKIINVTYSFKEGGCKSPKTKH